MSERTSLDGHEWITSWSARDAIRLLAVTELDDSAVELGVGTPIADVLNFDRMTPHVKAHGAVLPNRYHKSEFDPQSVSWKRAGDFHGTIAFSESLWSLPGCGVSFIVQRVDLDKHTDRGILIRCLEDMYYGDLKANIDPHPQESWPLHPSPRIHQLIFLPDRAEGEDLSDDDIQRLVYRADLPARPEFVRIGRPDELNRRPNRGAACGPFVSVLWGQQDYIENCAFLSAVMASTASAVIRDGRVTLVREIAHIDRMFGIVGDRTQARPSIDEARLAITRANRVVSRIQNRIALCIDGMATLMPFVPSLRPESYHRTLFEAIDSRGNREALERMLGRLVEMIRVEQDALELRVSSRSELRSRRWTISVGLASATAIPFTLVFGYFGMNASEVQSNHSMFDPEYWAIYGGVLLISALIIAVHVALLWRHRRRRRSLDVG